MVMVIQPTTSSDVAVDLDNSINYIFLKMELGKILETQPQVRQAQERQLTYRPQEILTTLGHYFPAVSDYDADSNSYAYTQTSAMDYFGTTQRYLVQELTRAAYR